MVAAASPNGFAPPIAGKHSTPNVPNVAQRAARQCSFRLSYIDQPKPENAPAATPEPSGDFDWSSDHSIVLHHQPAVAVYINEAGGLTIRQGAIGIATGSHYRDCL